jgi:hypothetical protein
LALWRRQRGHDLIGIAQQIDVERYDDTDKDLKLAVGTSRAPGPNSRSTVDVRRRSAPAHGAEIAELVRASVTALTGSAGTASPETRQYLDYLMLIIVDVLYQKVFVNVSCRITAEKVEVQNETGFLTCKAFMWSDITILNHK